MTNQSVPVYFYIPPTQWLTEENIPQNPAGYRDWQVSRRSMYVGHFDWTLQTYLHLKHSHVPCELIREWPDEGIVLSHRAFLKDSYQPSNKLLLVCLQADFNRHPYAQIHVVQNPSSATPGKFALWQSYFVPFWPQAGLIPRNPDREDAFENIGFFGDETNLVPEFKEPRWQEQLNDLGLQWLIKKTYDEWADYSNVDAVIAIRSFGRRQSYPGKPANKLYNAWQAGVPAILGYESAFRAERRSELDYLEATSVEAVLAALKRLRDDVTLRRSISANGLLRVQEVQPEQIVQRWQDFLVNQAIPAYKRWRQTPGWQQETFLKGRRYLALKQEGLQRRMQFLGKAFN